MKLKYLAAATLTLVLVSACSVAWVGAQGKSGAVNDKKTTASADQDGRQALLEVVGALAGSQLYQTYLNIGFIADGRAEGTYDDTDAGQLLGSVLELLDVLDKQLEKVSKLDLDDEDRASTAQVRKLSGLLRQQGKDLRAFWDSDDKKRGDKYEKTRQEAWAGISKLLGIEEKSKEKD
jgi:hypothetical protein